MDESEIEYLMVCNEVRLRTSKLFSNACRPSSASEHGLQYETVEAAYEPGPADVPSSVEVCWNEVIIYLLDNLCWQLSTNGRLDPEASTTLLQN